MALEDKMVEEKLKAAVLRGAQLLIDNGLEDWKIKLNNKRTSLAETMHSTKTIFYSKPFLTVATQDQFDGVTLHEAAHALLGPGHGHNDTFIRKCIEISPTPDYAKRATDVPIRKFILTCPSCGYSGSHNMGGKRYCGLCFKKGEKVIFEVKENVLKVEVW